MSERNDDFDELASAYLDDELDPADRAVVESDPELRETVAEFEALSSRIAEGVAPPAGSFDAALDAALAELAPQEGAPPKNNVIEFKRRRFGMLAGVGAAAAAVVGLVFITSPSSDDQDDTAAVATEFDEESDASGAESAAPDTTPPSVAEPVEADVAADENSELDDAGPAGARLIEQFDAANLLIEIKRITTLLDQLELEPLAPSTLLEKQTRSLDDCDFEGDVVLIDSIEDVEVVVIKSGNRLAIVIPETCEVITVRPIG